MPRRIAFLVATAAALLSSRAAADEPETRLLSHPLWLTGAALTAAGGPLTIFGLMNTIGGDDVWCEGGCPPTEDELEGRVMLAFGLPAVAVGVPLIVIGTRSIPVTRGSVLSWSVGPGSASLRCSF